MSEPNSLNSTKEKTCFMKRRIPFVNPNSKRKLREEGDKLIDDVSGESFTLIKDIPRFCHAINYSDSFGFQWTIFDKTQLDVHSRCSLTEARFFAQTAWDSQSLSNACILEVGSGAGRFSEVVLRTTEADLYSIDYSNAVEVNLRNNQRYRNRLYLVQGSVYSMPFPDSSFDKIFCFGVLQHTPSVQQSISAMVCKAKLGGEIVVDFYPINGWYTKLHSKYILRPITKRVPKELLLGIIIKLTPMMMLLFDLLCHVKLDILTRFIPITDLRLFPKTLSTKQRFEWAVMDTFDAFSPEYDNPQRLSDVVNFFKENGCVVTYAGPVSYEGGQSVVVRAVREK